MKKNLNQEIRCLITSLLLSGGSLGINAQDKSSAVLPTDSTATQANGKEVKNRNVMLGAGDSTTPRTLNIGLPFTLGKDPVTISKWCTNTTQPDLQTLSNVFLHMKP